MGLTNSQVAQYWKQGKHGHNGRNNFSTDGINIYSYNLLVGTTLKTGEKIAMNRVAISQTTYGHFRALHPQADRLVEPIKTGYYSSYNHYALDLKALELETIQQLEYQTSMLV